MGKGGIYKIVNLVNEKFYIGSTVNLIRRKYNHFSDLRKNKHINQYLQRSYNKYGKENFRFEVIEYVENKDKLIEREQYYLDIYRDNKKNCYNIRTVVESNLGIKWSNESKQKLSKAKKGIKRSKETKRKLSEAKKGEKNPNYGNKLSEKEKLKLAIAHGAKTFLVYDKQGNYVGEFINQSGCAEKLNLDVRSINNCLKNKQKSTGGYIFKYAS